MEEKGLCGGVNNIANRYSKPNTKYVGDYDKNKESSYLMYLDANKLYGWAMSQPLATGGFKLVKNDKWDDKFNLDFSLTFFFTRKEGIGYFVECDLEYPENLHGLHNDYPLAPEKTSRTR